MITAPIYWNRFAFPAQAGQPVAISKADFESCCCNRYLPENLYLEYRWAAPMRDLDTGTTFLGGIVGWSCGSSAPYLLWHGDNTGNGPEIVEVDVTAAHAAGLWTNSVQVLCAAGLYIPAGGSGLAALYAFFNGVIKTKIINPGQQDSCATTPVGIITLHENGTFELT